MVFRPDIRGKQRAAEWIKEASKEKSSLARLKKLNSIVYKQLKFDSSLWNVETFRRKSSQEVIASGKATGCSDMAKAFFYSARKAGFRDAEILECFQKTIPKNRGVLGHVFIKVPIKNEHYYFDPTHGKMYTEKEFLTDPYCQKYVITGHGKSFTQIGTDSWEKLKALRNKLIEERKITVEK